MERDYQVFISFKNSDDETEEDTLDKEIAYKVYKYLTDRRLNVFFSPVTLKALGRDSWSEEIDIALKESKVFIAVGTQKEYMNAKWVKEERTKFFGLKLNDKSRAIYGYIASPVTLKDLPDDMGRLEVFQDKKAKALDSLYDYIHNHLARDFDSKLNVIQLLSNDTSLSQLRQKLLTSHSIHELKRLLYEVENYQLQYPNCVDSKILMDSINKAIENTQKMPINHSVSKKYNIRKIIYITSTILITVLPIYYIYSINKNKVKGVDVSPSMGSIGSNRKGVLFSIPIGAKIRWLKFFDENNTKIYDSDNFPKYFPNGLPKGTYIVEVYKKGYKTKIIKFKLDEYRDIKVILEKKKKKNLKYYRHYKKYTWKEAKQYCENLEYKKYTNWRLPIEEDFLRNNGKLLSIVNSWTYKNKKTIKVWMDTCSDNSDCLTFNTHPSHHNHFYYLEEYPKQRHFSVLCVSEDEKSK